MDQAVEMSSGLLNLLSHVVFAVQIEDIGDQVKGILVVLDVGIQSREVKAVGQVVFVDLAEVFIAS